MNENARHLWAVAAIKDIDPMVGLAGWLKTMAAGATSPGPEDMRKGLAAMGLDEAKRVMDEIVSRRDGTDSAALGRLHGQLNKALNDKAAQATRQAWIRGHLQDLLPR